MMKDLFALLEDGALPDPSQNSLPILSVWRVTIYYVIFFTLYPEMFDSHHDKEKGSYLCLGDGCCPACDAGIKKTEHIYLPVWDVQSRRVAVLKFDTRPDGPARTILPFLRLYKSQLAEVVAVLDCRGGGDFTIIAHELQPETDRGALACKQFDDSLEAGTINLRRCVSNLSAQEIGNLKSVKQAMVPVVGKQVMPAATIQPLATPALAPSDKPAQAIDNSVQAPVDGASAGMALEASADQSAPATARKTRRKSTSKPARGADRPAHTSPNDPAQASEDKPSPTPAGDEQER
jgi:hypothetical protein